MSQSFSNGLEPSEDKVVAKCSRCKGEIYFGEEYASDGDRTIHCDCVNDEFTALPLFARLQRLDMELKGGEVYA